MKYSEGAYFCSRGDSLLRIEQSARDLLDRIGG